jgi:hypothetical protein
MTDQWTENLRCRACTDTGIATLSQGDGDQMSTVRSIPDGFKVVQTEYGPDFHSENCNVPALNDPNTPRHLRADLPEAGLDVRTFECALRNCTERSAKK